MALSSAVRPSHAVLAALFAIAGVAAASCSSAGGADAGATPAAKAGSNGGPCYGNQTCDAPLTCNAATKTCAGAGQGDEGGACYPNKTCNLPSLACISMLCVAPGPTGAGGAAGKGGSGAGATGGTGQSAGSSAAGNGAGGDTCAGTAYGAKQDPAALLFVLDRSVSMAGGKWQSLAAAVTSAMDDPQFDTMSVGFLAAPSGDSPSPACISALLPTVPCLAPSAPQIAITDVGPKPASDPSSFRHLAQAGLAAAAPAPNGLDPDATPLYAAIKNGITALQQWPKPGKRILVIVTDGTIDCNEGSGRPGFPDGNGCAKEWEDPNNIVALVKGANMDGAAPIQTFVVGVPGADTYDPSGANFPPYHMRLALSAIASAGAPTLVDPACNGKTFTQSAGDPSVPCHFDMTSGGFDAKTLGENLGKIRNKSLGCTFDLPVPAMGTIDPNKVNVQINFGMGLVSVPKRGNPNDQCLDHPCWDYDANGKVEVIGQACKELESTAKAAVSIVAGCDTIVLG